MAGFFGLFRRKAKSVDQTNNGQGQNNQSKESYFLKPDDAKTWGNIEYMKKSIVIRRTYAKTTAAGEIPESIRSISSTEEKRLKANEIGKTESSSATTPNSPQVNKAKRSSDNSMDVFRKMARDLNK